MLTGDYGMHARDAWCSRERQETDLGIPLGSPCP